jgi:predicted nucleic acid-binding protein
MVLIDSSVFISLLRQHQTEAVDKLETVIRQRRALVADLVMLEILQGARTKAEASRLTEWLLRFRRVEVLSEDIAIAAAAHYRVLRSKGITIRKTADVIIATFCIAQNFALLHDDRDFSAMATHLGLKVY